MIQTAACLVAALLVAAPPAIRPDRPVDTTEALTALKAVRHGDEAPVTALGGRPFRIFAPVAAADWSYDPTFGVLTYRPRLTFWSGSTNPRLEKSVGLRLNGGAGEPLGVALAPAAFDWFMGGEGLSGVRLPLPPDNAADASRSLRLMIEGQIEPLDAHHAIACGAPGEGCILGARIDDLMLVYGPTGAPHILARWDPAMGE